MKTMLIDTQSEDPAEGEGTHKNISRIKENLNKVLLIESEGYANLPH